MYEALERAAADAPDEAAADSCEEFASQLAWREFYAHVLTANPETVTENYRSYEHPIEWRTDPDALQAWKDGETGIRSSTPACASFDPRRSSTTACGCSSLLS